MRLKLLGAVVAALAMAIAATAALAAPAGAGTCAGGLVGAGTYNGLTVTGTCFFDNTGKTIPTITINGNLTIAPGGSLNAHDGTLANVHVTGNVIVEKNGIVGLGNYGGPSGPVRTDTVVDGNVLADQPQSLFLSFMTIHGNLVSHGGSGPEFNFPLKNLTVGGNVDLQGWSGGWIGLLRSTVGGNVNFSNNIGNVTGDFGTPDSSEVASNVITGNLICHGNDPAAQLGDSIGNGTGPNTVGGQALGQCAAISQKP